MIELLERLCELPGPSGCEDAVRDYIRKEAQPYADEIREDSIGNLMVFRRGSCPNGKTVMLAAHMDEVGFIVSDITDDGSRLRRSNHLLDGADGIHLDVNVDTRLGIRGLGFLGHDSQSSKS